MKQKPSRGKPSGKGSRGSVITEDGTLYFYSHTFGAHQCFSQFYECHFCDPDDGTAYCCAEQYMMVRAFPLPPPFLLSSARLPFST